jgi:hypothetical protein
MSGTRMMRANVSVLEIFTTAQTPGSSPSKHRLKLLKS